MTTVSSTGSAFNTSRISGLASGMDTDTMITEMMGLERIPMDKLIQQKQILEWQQEDYRSLNTALYSFKEQAFSLRLEGTFDARNALAADTGVLTATAGNSALEGSYAITVNSLAAGVTKGSGSQLADEKDADGNTLTLYQQFSEFSSRDISAEENITVTINGTVLEFDLDQDTIATMVAKINNADLGVKASYDSTYKRFFLNTTTTGSEAGITISSDAANLLASGTESSILKLSLDEGVSYNGHNASIDCGDAIGLESATNTVTINGLTLNLKSEGRSTVTVTSDVDTIVNSIKEFVNAYNQTMETLYSKVQEKRDRDYAPLTDAQKEEMSDDEIEKWESKAHRGLLRNDTLLQNIISNLRSSMSGTVDGMGGQFDSLSGIGISTGLYQENGKLHINEGTLREAIIAHPDSIKDLFTHSSSHDDEKGIAYKLYEMTANGIKYLSDKAGSDASYSTVDNSYIGKRLTAMVQAIEDWEDKLDKIEERYYKQFTAMETYINQMNSQSMWLSAQFSSSS